MPTLIRHKPRSEKELHAIIEKELDAIEEGLELLSYEMGFSKGIPDFLCMDSGGRLVIIEVKLHEDENVIFQALRYFNIIDPDRYKIAKMFPDMNIDPSLDPRIIIIAGKFSDDLRRMTTLVMPEIELYEYSVLKTPEGQLGMYFHSVSLPKMEDHISAPKTLEDHINYMTKDELKPVFKKAYQEILDIDPNIKGHARQTTISFQISGRQIGYLFATRKAFDVGALVVDENGRFPEPEAVRIENAGEEYEEVLEKIKRTYEIVK